MGLQQETWQDTLYRDTTSQEYVYTIRALHARAVYRMVDVCVCMCVCECVCVCVCVGVCVCVCVHVYRMFRIKSGLYVPVICGHMTTIMNGVVTMIV